MGTVELLARSAAYFLCLYCLHLAVWPLVRRALPGAAPSSLRLGVLLLAGFALNAVLVQILGLSGALSAPAYLGSCLALASGALFFSRDRDPFGSLARLVRRAAAMWIGKSPFGIGYFGLVAVLVLAFRVGLVEGTDSLSIHGPAVVEWIQQGRIQLLSGWNYPLCWEYQYVPNLMLLRSDVLAVVPRLLQTAAFMLLLREVARRLSVGSRSALLLTWFVSLSPLIWRTESMKNDVTFAAGLLAGLLAVERLWRRRPGGALVGQLGVFFLFGTKPSGFLYAGLILVPMAILTIWSRPPDRRLRQAMAFVLVTGLVQATPLAVQLANLIENGNPVYPIEVSVGGRPILPGKSDLRGTSILENAGNLEVWKRFGLKGSRFSVGIEFPVVILLFLAAAVHSGAALASRRDRFRIRRRAWILFFAACGVTLLLWLLYLRSPWSAGSGFGQYNHIKFGASLRYAITQIGLTYVLAYRYLEWLLKGRRLLLLSSLAFPALLYFRWFPHLNRNFGDDKHEVVLAVLLGAFLAFVLGRMVKRVLELVGDGRLARGLKVALTMALVALAVDLYATALEGRRQARWVKVCQPVWTFVHDHVRPGSRIGVTRPHANLRYMLYGESLENRLMNLAPRAFADPESLPPGVEYVFVKFPRGKTRSRILRKLDRAGWETVASCRKRDGVLVARGGVQSATNKRPASSRWEP